MSLGMNHRNSVVPPLPFVSTAPPLGLVNCADLVHCVDLVCEDRIGTGPLRARTEVIYGDPASWGIILSVFGW
jgi:hypothetical protein